MNSLVKTGLGLVVFSMLVGYFNEIVYFFGLFFGIVASVFDLFMCLGADENVVRGATKVLSLEIIFFLVYFLYSRFFK